MFQKLLFLYLFFIQVSKLSSFYSAFKVSARQASPIYANPLFFGGKRLPLKDGEKPKDSASVSIKPDRSEEDEEAGELNQLVKIHDEERLQKVIARAGLASRREAEKMVSYSRKQRWWSLKFDYIVKTSKIVRKVSE
jgi:hypothetical protein